MANNPDSAPATPLPAAPAAASGGPSQFEARRSELLVAISASLETVLQQVNQLNRTLEGIIEIGSEFGSVEALWSQFESVMGKTNEEQGGEGEEEGEGEGEGEEYEDEDEDEETEQTIVMDPKASRRNQDAGIADEDDRTVRLNKGKRR